MTTVVRKARAQRGYVLIVAVLILVAITAIGFVFLGLINRNLTGSQQERRRSFVRDVALAGVRYAHSQLLYSELGADWRGSETPPVSTQDPDYEFLKPGGPDGKGFFTRLTFQNGRALVRVSYAPSDASVLQNVPSGPLRQPGVVRNYIMIESVGRSGRLLPNDPTVLGSAQRGETMKMIAFASCGIIESARFITAKTRTTRPAEIGSPTELGAMYGADAVNVPVSMGQETVSGGELIRYGGSIYSNADLLIYGDVSVTLNKGLGDAILVAGNVAGADDDAALTIRRHNFDDSDVTGDQVIVKTNATSLDSRSANFSTEEGVFRDGLPQIDPRGFPRGVARKEPPSILAVDPNTGRNRYLTLTRESGRLTSGGMSSQYGHGRNVYVNNGSDLQVRPTEEGREDVGTSESLTYDWLNPNNGQANSGWRGPYYVPPGAFLELTYDGFVITRTGTATSERTWRNEDGTDSGLTTTRYRIGDVDEDGAGPLPARPYIVNTLTPGIDINASLVEDDYAQGFPFDGVLYFDGNVRVRGVVPDQTQLTVVSMGTIYVEGSITKMPDSNSMIMLMAKDNVALNTSQFVGPAIGQSLEVVSDEPNTTAWHSVRVASPNGTLDLQTEFVRDEDTGDPLAMLYREFVNPSANVGPFIDSNLMLTHTMDDGAASNSFFSLDVNFGLATPAYQFELTPYNAATPYYSPDAYGPIYGLGDQPWQKYPKFESQWFPLVQNTFTNNDPEIDATGDVGAYGLLLDETNHLTISSNNVGAGSTNDYLLAKTALIPHDVLIEASMYAEEGSFFVIPGNWYEPDPNDRRDLYDALGATDAERQQNRLENYGAFPELPFYGEPPDIRVRIVGSVSENMPPPISQQSEWIRKWGWIPRQLGSTGMNIPWQHVPEGFDVTGADLAVPNLIISYDLDLATGKANGFGGTSYLRVDGHGRPLPPMPRLPVSPSLAYFGEVNP